MSKWHSGQLARDFQSVVKKSLDREGAVNVPAIAMEIHQRQGWSGLSLRELEGQVLAAALAMNAVILFHRPASGTEYETSRALRNSHC